MSNFVLKGSKDTYKPVSRLMCVARSLGLVDLASRVMKTPTCFLCFGCTRTPLWVSEANIGRSAFPPNHGRGGQRCRTSMLVRLSAAFGHRLSVDVTPGLSRSRRLPVVVDAFALTMRRRWSRLLNAE